MERALRKKFILQFDATGLKELPKCPSLHLSQKDETKKEFINIFDIFHFCCCCGD